MSENLRGAIKTFNIETINYINAFENFTRCKVKDCIITEEGLMFVVDAIYIGRILGVKGSNIKKIEERFKKKVRIIEFSDNIQKFILNLLYPIRPRDIKIADGRVEIVPADGRMKGLLLGRDRKNLKRLQELVLRYFKYTIEVS